MQGTAPPARQVGQSEAVEKEGLQGSKWGWDGMNGGTLLPSAWETTLSKEPSFNAVHFPFLQKQLITKSVLATPVPLRGRLSGAGNPGSHRRSQGWPHTGRSALCGKGSTKRPALSAAKMNVR